MRRLFLLLSGEYNNLKSQKVIFDEDKDYERGFSNYYEKKIRPQINIFEQSRIQALNKVRLRLRLAILLFFLWILSSILFPPFLIWLSSYNYFAIGLAFIFIGVSAWIILPINKYKDSLKSSIFPKIINFFSGCKYLSSRNVDFDSFKKCGFSWKGFNTNLIQDQISGSYRGITFNSYIMNLKEKQSVSKNSIGREAIVSPYIAMSFNLNKKFKYKTILKVSNVGRPSDKLLTLNKVKLLTSKYENIFDIFSENEKEARNLVTDSLLEILTNFTQIDGANNIEGVFCNGRFSILIPQNKLLFQPRSVFMAEDFIDDSKDLLKQMNVVSKIADVLKG
jgi:hypothetical protein